MAGGRPTIYSLDIANTICEQLANGKPLSHICRGDGMPRLSTVYGWFIVHPEFSELYARAREDQADTLADEIIMIADEYPLPDSETGKIDSAWVAWQRNRVDARKWTASKLKPKRYGEKTETTHTGSVEIKHVVREIVDHAED